jgi:hypothetical protein
VTKVDEYREFLSGTPVAEWQAFLADHSGLPGPRANLELIHAVAEVGDAQLLRRYAGADDEFLAACGAVGLGRLLAGGDPDAEADMHRLACDVRWRAREGVAMGLQRLGDEDLQAMLDIVERWAGDSSLLVRRAAVAGLCEPRLLGSPDVMPRVFAMLDAVTAGIAGATGEDRRSDPFRVLRQALGYCWSVAIAAAPVTGLEQFDRWQTSTDGDVQWIVRENLKKARMRKAFERTGRT